MNREAQLKEATENLNKARVAFFLAKTSKEQREAAEDAQFWGSRAAMLSTEKGWSK